MALKYYGFIGIAFIGLLLSLPVSAAAVFSDVSSNHPHFEAIMALHDQGVIEGYSNNTFRPEQSVNRAEALKIILLGSNVLVPEIQPQPIFPDVVHGVWYDKSIWALCTAMMEQAFFAPEIP
jgi:hypothetical protein